MKELKKLSTMQDKASHGARPKGFAEPWAVRVRGWRGGEGGRWGMDERRERWALGRVRRDWEWMRRGGGGGVSEPWAVWVRGWGGDGKGVGREWGVDVRREGFAEPCAVWVRGWRGGE